MLLWWTWKVGISLALRVKQYNLYMKDAQMKANNNKQPKTDLSLVLTVSFNKNKPLGLKVVFG